MSAQAEPNTEAAPGAPVEQPSKAAAPDSPAETGGLEPTEGGAGEGDRTIVELAIERALDTVAAELQVVTESEVARISAKPENTADRHGAVSGGAETGHAPMSEPATPEDAIARLAAVAATRRPADQPPAASVGDEAAPMAQATRPAAAAPPPVVPERSQPRPDDSTAARPGVDTPAQPLSQLLAQMSPPTSVEELRRAVAASGGRDLEQILEGVIRPAVREWLSNNLSTLAERIVREEIERVSRQRE